MAKNNIQQFESIRILGSLLGTKVLEDLRFYKLDGQNPADYGVEKGLKLSDELSRYWRIAQTRWQEYQQQRERTDVSQQQLAIQDWLLPLLEKVLGYQIDVAQTQIIGEREFPITHFAHNGDMPLVLCGADKDLDKGDVQFGQEGRKRSPMGLAQEYLNAESKCLWAIVSNGVYLRLLRDNPAMTRSAYIEVDFARLFEEDNYADFATLWLLLHATRTAPREGSLEKSWLETWRAKGLDEGERIVEKLRFSVADALRQLGTGFVAHPKNTELRQKLDSGELTTDVYFQQVLRLVYRMLFLLTAEDRNIALFPGAEYKAARSLYDKGYSISSLRERARFKRNHDYYGDAWQQLLINFSGFANGQPALAQPALGGLFAENQCPDIDACELQNRYFYAALYKLCYFEQGHSLARINYRDMNTEEFGSVYEALLELTPQLHTQGQWSFSFQGDAEGEQTASGNARKLSGAYYTPDSLVQELIKSALVPVIEDRLKGKVNQADKRAAILSITVCDPACGSGHFLLGAARRLAAELAQIDADKDQPTDEHYRHALRDVLANCIFGVDRNPMSVELAKVAMWIEGVEPGKALSFLDHHIVCGDALLGVMDLKQLEKGIPAAAFKALSGDDKEVCKRLGKTNTAALKQLAKEQESKQFRLELENGNALAAFNLLEALPAETTTDIAEKEIAYKDFLQQAKTSPLNHACDLLLGAFLQTKTLVTEKSIPTTGTLMLELSADYRSAEHEAQLEAAQAACKDALVLHWPLTFPQIFAKGGFDCVLGNPPWERIKLQEEEFFSTRNADIATAKNKAERTQRILLLEQGLLTATLYPDLPLSPIQASGEISLYKTFITARRVAEAASIYVHVGGEEGGRYPLTGVGDVNTYALFSESISQLMAKSGRSGFIVPTGIATDDSTKDFFGHIIRNEFLVSLYDFENRAPIFPGVHRSFKFCLLTIGASYEAWFSFFLCDTNQIYDKRRRFRLKPLDFDKINPNTLNCPIFRSNEDAEIARKIYGKYPVLIRDECNGNPEENPWGIKFHTRFFHMAEDSHHFVSSDAEGIPVYEAKMIHIYDHRWASYDSSGEMSFDSSLTEKNNPHFMPLSRYKVDKKEFLLRSERNLNSKVEPNFFFSWRLITNSTNERTIISALLPSVAVSHSLPTIFFPASLDKRLIVAFVANFSSLVLDFFARQKIGGTNLTLGLVKQLPVLHPKNYSDANLNFIVPRVMDLIYTSFDFSNFAGDLGYFDSPFEFDVDRRAIIRAELDAYYAKLYGLTRDELRYILDPADVMGAEYPSETFRVLKNNEMKEFGEYRTRSLVLREFDRMTLAEANGEEYTSLLVPPPGQKADPTYASVGVFRDHEDAQLAGLIWAAIATGSACQAEIRGLLTLLTLPQALDIYLSPESLATAKQLFNKYQPLFTQERINHADTIISYFKRQALVRTDSKGILSVSTHSEPDGIQVNDELTTLAEHLLVAAKASLQSDKQQTGADTETSTKSA